VDISFSLSFDLESFFISVGFGFDFTAPQNINSLLGKILRITPILNGDGSKYSVPCKNPYVKTDGLDEIYAEGTRNPRKMYFADDDLFIGDVGDQWDEINQISSPKVDMGYPTYDGCYSGPGKAPNGFSFPIYSYTDANAPHTITMGPYYTGPIAALKNRVLFADLYSGQISSFDPDNTKANCGTVVIPLANVDNASPPHISAFVIIDDVIYVTDVFGSFNYPATPSYYKLVQHF